MSKATFEDTVFYRQVVVETFGKNSRFYHFLVDCIQSPDVAAAVTTIVFSSRGRARSPTPRDDGSFPIAPKDAPQGKSLEDFFSKALEPLELGDEKGEWVNALTRAEGDYAAYATILLLTLCPNVEHLVSNIIDRGAFLNFLHRNNYGQLPHQYLQKLKHVTILPGSLFFGYDSYATADVLANALLFHRLPSLESYSIRSVEENDDQGYSVVAVPNTSNLKSISIINSELTSSGLAALIRIPRALESFKYHNGGEWSHLGGHSAFFEKTIAKALRTQRDSLTEIDMNCDSRSLLPDLENENVLNFRWQGVERSAVDMEQDLDIILDRKLESGAPGPLCPSELPDIREYLRPIGPLNDFSALKRLKIGAIFLLGSPYNRFDNKPLPSLIDALPQSLEFLQIRGYTKGEFACWDKVITEFSAQRASQLPNLKVIEGVDERIKSDRDIPRRKPHDPNQPKRAVTSYFLFMQEKKPLIKQQHPNWDSWQVSVETERLWSTIPRKEKNKLEYRYEVDLARYYKQREEYEAGQPVREISFEEAESLYKDHLRYGKLIKGRKGMRILRNALEAGKLSSADRKSALKAIKAIEKEEDRIQRQSDEMEILALGPEYFWIKVGEESESESEGSDSSSEDEDSSSEEGESSSEDSDEADGSANEKEDDREEVKEEEEEGKTEETGRGRKGMTNKRKRQDVESKEETVEAKDEL